MAEAAEVQAVISEQEYLDEEKLSDTRHEYVAGYVYEETGNWWVQVYDKLDDTLLLPCVNQPVTLADIYEAVVF